MSHQNKDPLHGITLEQILHHLVEEYGWREMGELVPIRCFRHDPSIKSSLQFLRRTPWARQQVEQLYLHSLSRKNAPAESPFRRINPADEDAAES